MADQLMSDRELWTVFAKNGLVDELKRALAERALHAEMDHDQLTKAADGGSNSGNGYGKKTVPTDASGLGIAIVRNLAPRDRLSTFGPQLIA